MVNGKLPTISNPSFAYILFLIFLIGALILALAMAAAREDLISYLLKTRAYAWLLHAEKFRPSLRRVSRRNGHQREALDSKNST